MSKDQNSSRRTTPKEALTSFLTFIEEDPASMDRDELDAYLAESGFDFAVFNERLTRDIEQAVKKARLIEAKASRDRFVHRVRQVVSTAAMTIEEKRAEIQQRLGLLGGQAAGVFNRNYENAEDEEGLDSLLADLRALDDRTQDRSDES